jgi:hypothetical protein
VHPRVPVDSLGQGAGRTSAGGDDRGIPGGEALQEKGRRGAGEFVNGVVEQRVVDVTTD